MRRAVLVFLVAIFSSVLFQGTATAGGWWNFIGLEGPIAVGESLTHRVEDVSYSTNEETEAAEQAQWYAYLLPRFDRQALDRAMLRADPGDWWEPPAEMIPAGQVDVSMDRLGFLDATVHLTVPDITTGSYHLMLCDLGCRTPLGDVIPDRVDVAADAFSAQLARRVERTNFRLQTTLRRLRGQLNRTRNALSEAEASSRLSREAVTTLAHRVSELERAEPPSTPWSAYAGWFLAGAATSVLAVVVIRRRKTASTAESEPPAVQVPDDPRELIESR